MYSPFNWTIFGLESYHLPKYWWMSKFFHPCSSNISNIATVPLPKGNACDAVYSILHYWLSNRSISKVITHRGKRFLIPQSSIKYIITHPPHKVSRLMDKWLIRSSIRKSGIALHEVFFFSWKLVNSTKMHFLAFLHNTQLHLHAVFFFTNSHFLLKIQSDWFFPISSIRNDTWNKLPIRAKDLPF